VYYYQVALRRVFLVVAALALVAVVPVRAQGVSPAPPAPAPAESGPVAIPEGVTIAGVGVGGMTADQARIAVQASFERPVEFAYKKKLWRATPVELGARPYVEGAVRRALEAHPFEAVPMVVTIRGVDVRAYVAHLADLFSRPPKDATLRLRRLRPYLTKPREGLRVLRPAMTASIVRALKANERGPIELEATVTEPKLTLANFGPVVVIRRETKKLYLYRGQRYWKRFGVATGQSSYPTPVGRFAVVVKQRDPWWYPPRSVWARGLSPVPPGPGNPLGTRWMGISVPGVGIHGTPDAASIGYSASHGCVRMRIPDAEWLFGHVAVGTPVFIVNA
jgi:hypothetical protein